MEKIMKAIRKSAEEYQEGHEKTMAKIAQEASNDQIRELQRISMSIQDVVLLRLGIE